jgi:DoxX-like family
MWLSSANRRNHESAAKESRVTIAYWVSTTLVCVFFAMTGFMELTHNPHMVHALVSMGYPEYSLGAEGLAKVLGVLALVLPVPVSVREWAYAGLTYLAIAFTLAHFATHGEPHVAIALLLLTQASYWLWRKLTIPGQARP